MAKGNKKKIIEFVSETLAGFLENEGYSLYHANFAKEGQNQYLKVYIDKGEGYVGTDDCEKVSRFLSDALDNADIIEQNYYLMVSSPGIDRELITYEHFERYIGEDVDISLYKAYDGEKQFMGKLVERTPEHTVIDRDGNEITLPNEQISKVRLAVVI